MKAIQLFMLTASLLVTFTLFIGAFFNPSYWLFVPGMTYLSYLIFQRKAMVRDIYIIDPDGEQDFDGFEDTEDPEDVYQREWENTTMYW